MESTGGGREGWSRGWVGGSRGEKRDGKHSSSLCMYAYKDTIASSLSTHCEDLFYRVSPKSSWVYLKGPTRLILISVRPLIPVHSKFRKYFVFFSTLFFPPRPFQLYADPIPKQCLEQKHGSIFQVCVWEGRGECKDGGDRDYSDRHDCSHLAFKRQLKPASNIWLSGFCPDLVDDQRILSTLSRPRP